MKKNVKFRKIITSSYPKNPALDFFGILAGEVWSKKQVLEKRFPESKSVFLKKIESSKNVVEKI